MLSTRRCENCFRSLNNKLFYLISKHGSNYNTTYERERQIMRLLAIGLNNTDIADKLYCSMHTVKNHKENIKAKLAIDSCKLLLQIAIKYRDDW